VTPRGDSAPSDGPSLPSSAAIPSVQVEIDSKGNFLVHYEPDRPPRVLLDTNVILGLGAAGEHDLRRLRAERRFKFRYSMTNFVELASHLADPPSEKTPDPFTRYRAAFRRLHTVFNGVLPSAESTLMRGVGLAAHTGSRWIVDGVSIRHQVMTIAKAETLEDVRKAGIDPGHYKRLREVDALSFLGVVAQARKEIRDVHKDLEPGGRVLQRFVDYLILRASSGTLVASDIEDHHRSIAQFFREAGGKMFLNHFIKLLLRMIRDGANDDPNDFYDMLQLLLLSDTNLLFVSDDRPFFQYYVGSDHHRIVRWTAFRTS
jgi:hypothetical protein